MMTNDIYYEKLVNNAFLDVVRTVLKDMSTGKLETYPALYITFKTTAQGVQIPDSLLQRFPNEMTIVLQHQFENLNIASEKFSVTLSFSGKKENLVIPFNSLSSFHDMDTNFTLTFKPEALSPTPPKKAEIINFSDFKKSKK